jgi:hypothetical protein
MSDQHNGGNRQCAAVLACPPDSWMFRYRFRTRSRVSRLRSHDSLVSIKSDDSTTSCVPDTSISVCRRARATVAAFRSRQDGASCNGRATGPAETNATRPNAVCLAKAIARFGMQVSATALPAGDTSQMTYQHQFST